MIEPTEKGRGLQEPVTDDKPLTEEPRAERTASPTINLNPEQVSSTETNEITDSKLTYRKDVHIPTMY